MSTKEIAEMPLIHVIWNRCNVLKDTIDLRPKSQHDYLVYYFHGHDVYHSSLPYVYNMNSRSGMGAYEHQQKDRAKLSELLANPSLNPEESLEIKQLLADFNEKILDSDEDNRG